MVVGCLYGGVMDEVMMRIIEILSSIPSLLLTIIIMIGLGNDMGALMLAMCITSRCRTARQIRGQVLQLREAEYVMVAEPLGAKPLRIIVKHLLPNTMGLLILDLATAIPSYFFRRPV